MNTMQLSTQNTLGTIVKQYHATAPVFEKYNLDYCCNGKRSLEAACREKEISVETLLTELENAIGHPSANNQDYNTFDPEQLMSHIILTHHAYVKQAIVPIEEHLLRVATKHGDRFPEMKKVYSIFLDVANELQLHMQKEEMILFPRIREVYYAGKNPGHTGFSSNFISGPVSVMEAEHTHAGNGLDEIRQLTKNYTPPVGACTTFCVALNELKAFEEDLHQHVHLENNILFPKAEELLLAVI
jgi:regulator of cell morphogenesis and NO signaling